MASAATSVNRERVLHELDGPRWSSMDRGWVWLGRWGPWDMWWGEGEQLIMRVMGSGPDQVVCLHPSTVKWLAGPGARMVSTSDITRAYQWALAELERRKLG